MASWPSGLPQSPRLRGHSEGREPNVVRTPVEQGPAKTRKLYTAEIRRFSIQLIMTGTQVDTFDTFYASTIDYGATAFDWVHPRTLTAASCKMLGEPNYIPQGGAGKYWLVSFQMEITP